MNIRRNLRSSVITAAVIGFAMSAAAAVNLGVLEAKTRLSGTGGGTNVVVNNTAEPISVTAFELAKLSTTAAVTAVVDIIGDNVTNTWSVSCVDGFGVSTNPGPLGVMYTGGVARARGNGVTGAVFRVHGTTPHKVTDPN